MLPVKGRPWRDIVEHFRLLVNGNKGGYVFLPMLQFVEQIATAEFTDRIHAITSMHDVIVSDLPEFDLDRDVLKIEFDPKAGMVRFEYWETRSPLYKRWKKTCPPEHAFSSFVRFLKLKQWLPRQ